MAKASAKSKAGKGKGNGGGGKTTPGGQPLIQLSLDQKLDILGLFLIVVAGVTIFSFLSSNQSVLTGSWLALLRHTFGLGMFIVPLVIGAAGLWLWLRRFEHLPHPKGSQLIGFGLTFFAALTSLSWIQPASSAAAGLGGSIGDWFTQLVSSAVGDFGGVVVLIAWWLLGIVFLFDISPSEMAVWLAGVIRALRPERDPGYTIHQPLKAGQSGRVAPPKVIGGAAEADPLPARSTEPPRKTPVVEPRPINIRPVSTPPQSAAQAEPEPLAAGESTGPLFPRTIGGGQVWQLPSVAEVFAGGAEAALSEDDIRLKVNLIEETLHSFGVEGRIVEVNRGPAITQFGVEPGFINRAGKSTKVKVSKISALADDLALALAARSIRIEAPVPGRNIVGIEVPNGETSLVSLRDVIESEAFQKIGSPLRFALGQGIAGEPYAADLAMMPHMLIAGTTGSGKSVCVNAIICCLLAFNTPDDLKLLLVDPKRVELTLYNGIPHLIAPVVVDLERVIGVLKWVTNEMDARYKRFAKAGARNIVDYNARIANEGNEERLPYIVLVIDELADLMMMAPDETEKMICRLAQMARATGIHLIISTQRPSVDVVTGLIKANFPARISFAVASSTDSRVILDTTGAERLLGRGDMLFISPDSGVPQRVQGCFVSDSEVHNIVRYWKGVRGAETSLAERVPADTLPVHQTPLWEDLAPVDDGAENMPEDDLLDRAIEVVRLQRRASISLLQRRLRIGYTRAARLIDLMEEKGIVGRAEESSRWREVLSDGP
ncbi:MAG TPA: DNA translocase FtsK [Anaerolineae bacterium]|nr:DNA translocase FtsK [Anaerolineae bacterium]